jgi:hypothetical protein
MPDRLNSDQVLEPGQSIASPNGRATLIMQSDGNLVLYQVDSGSRTALWATGTDVPGTRAAMQGDGNLALYGPGGECHWAAGTDGNPGAILALQDDGNLVIYAAAGSALWASGTSLPPEVTVKGDRLMPGQALESTEALESRNKRAVLWLRRQGSIVLFESVGQIPGGSDLAYWIIENNAPDSRLVMQEDGNLALYAPDGSCRWASGTDGNPGAWLTLQDDGNLVIYAGTGPALWASNTVRTWS